MKYKPECSGKNKPKVELQVLKYINVKVLVQTLLKIVSTLLVTELSILLLNLNYQSPPQHIYEFQTFQLFEIYLPFTKYN